MGIIIPDKSVRENNGYGRTINQLMEIFVLPEMKKRKIKEKDFQAVIVELFDDDRRSKMYFNKEATFIFSFKKQAPTRRGPIKVRLEELKGIKWNDKDLNPDSAKFFIIKWNKDYWVLGFDFRYNKNMAKLRLERAEEFLNAAETLNYKLFPNVLVYLLWSCAELIIDCKLYLIPGQKPTKRHKDRKDKIERFQKMSNIFSDRLISVFTPLADEKDNARYGDKMRKIINKNFIKETIDIFKKEIDLTKTELCS
jgi:hypothetical protein